jgi:hypothetical protein
MLHVISFQARERSALQPPLLFQHILCMMLTRFGIYCETAAGNSSNSSSTSIAEGTAEGLHWRLRETDT